MHADYKQTPTIGNGCQIEHEIGKVIGLQPGSWVFSTMTHYPKDPLCFLVDAQWTISVILRP